MLTIACLVLHYQTMSERQPHTILIAAGAFVGYTIILIGLFIGKFKQQSINKVAVTIYKLSQEIKFVIIPATLLIRSSAFALHSKVILFLLRANHKAAIRIMNLIINLTKIDCFSYFRSCRIYPDQQAH